MAKAKTAKEDPGWFNEKCRLADVDVAGDNYTCIVSCNGGKTGRSFTRGIIIKLIKCKL